MSNWLYANEEPTVALARRCSRCRGRSALRRLPEGLRLVQSPVAELASLRATRRPDARVAERGRCRDPPTSSSRSCAGRGARPGCACSTPPAKRWWWAWRGAAARCSWTDGGRGPRRSTTSTRAGTRARCAGAATASRLRVLFDRSTLEVFANDGETVISERVYPTRPLDRLELLGAGQAVPAARPAARAAVGVAMSPERGPLYGGVEGGGTKFVCVVGTGPDDVRAEARLATTSPEETIGEALAFFRDAQARLGPLAGIGIGSFGPVDLAPGVAARFGFITSTPKPGWKNVDLAGPFRRARSGSRSRSTRT